MERHYPRRPVWSAAIPRGTLKGMNATSTGLYVQPPPLLQLPYFLGLNPHLVLVGILAAVIIMWLIFTRILFYHWHKYAAHAPITFAVFFTHTLVSCGLFVLAFIGIV